MIGLDQNKYHWKRILMIMVIMTLISYFMGRMPTRDSQFRDAINEYAKHCPVYFENGLTLDSVNMDQPKDLNYYFSDNSGVGENYDSTQFVRMMRQFYRTRLDDSDFIRFLNEGYRINMMILRKDNSTLQFKLDSKTLEYPDQEI